MMAVRAVRKEKGVIPAMKRVDTCAAEFEAGACRAPGPRAPVPPSAPRPSTVLCPAPACFLRGVCCCMAMCYCAV